MPKNNFQKHILKNIELAPYQPYISHSSMSIIRWLATGGAEEKKLTEESVRRSFYRVCKSKYIKEKIIKTGKDEAKIKFELTKKGREILRGYEFNDMQIQKPQNWDGYWWVVVYDIREKNKYVREMTRAKLKELGFMRFQHSVWIHPYECAKEIEVISEFYHIQQSLLLFKAKLDNDSEAKKYFRQKGFKL